MFMKPEIVIAALVLGGILAAPVYAQFEDRDRSEMMRRQPVATNDASPAEAPVVHVPLPRARPRFGIIPLPRPAPDRGTGASPAIEMPEAVVNTSSSEASGSAEAIGIPFLGRGTDAGTRGPAVSPQPAHLLAPLLGN